MDKETLILESKNIVSAVNNTKDGAWNLFNYLQGGTSLVAPIDEFVIENNHTDTIIEEAEFVEKRHLKAAVINAHNKYVTLLGIWQRHHSEKLTRLLQEKET